MPIVSATLEYRGQIDTFDDLNRADAKNLFAFFQDEGLIKGDAPVCYTKMPPPSDLRATEYLKVDKPGLLIYQVALGDRVKKGDTVAELMTRELISSSPDETTDQVLQKMTDGRFRHMPVLDDGKLCGMITIGDVVNFRLNELEYESLRMKQMIVG